MQYNKNILFAKEIFYFFYKIIIITNYIIKQSEQNIIY